MCIKKRRLFEQPLFLALIKAALLEIYYSTVDGIVLTFSKVHKNGIFDEIDFRFERPNNKGGFDFAEGKLPMLTANWATRLCW